MLIRTRMGVSADGFIATPDGLPAFLAVPGFIPHGSYDWPAFNQQVEAVVMGRAGLDAGLGSGDWPWPGKQIYVLTSRPVPADVPAEVVVADASPKGLVGRLRAARLTGDAFLLGGQRTLHAFLALGAIDKLELLNLPVLLWSRPSAKILAGLSPPGTHRRSQALAHVQPASSDQPLPALTGSPEHSQSGANSGCVRNTRTLCSLPRGPSVT